MTTELHERLAGLASVTPATSPPPDLWPRGVRRRRVVAAGRTAVVAVLVLMVGLGGWAWHQTRPVEPADTHGTPHLPDGVYTPSTWLPSFDGPPGALVAVGVAERKTLFHTRPAVYGVTASTGAYGFVSLPGDAVVQTPSGDADGPSLSPDGTRIAYWLTGTPQGTPNTKLVGVTVTGVGVYDTATGRTWTVRVPTPHGLEPSTLQWLDGDRLVLGIEQASFGDANEEACCAGRWQQLATWGVGERSVDLMPRALPRFIEASGTSTRAGVVVFASGPLVHEINPVKSADRTVGIPRGTERAVLSPDRRHLAYVTEYGGGSRPPVLQVGEVMDRDGGRAPLTGVRTVVDHHRFVNVVAFVDANHVAVVARIAESDGVSYELVSVDIRSGAVTSLVQRARGEHGADPGGLSLATGLLSAPRAAAAEPGRPWDLRWAAGIIALCLVGCGLVTWGATRGRRA
jgi:hypothetical protein